MKILSVVGARPQFIKAAMVSRVIRATCQELLLHTGQHYDDNMSQVFFDELHLPKPEIYLGVGSGSHAQQTASILTGVEAVIASEKPDWLLVYGDTNTTLAGALAASKLQVPVAHVEAGLRSYNRAMPEEINRVLCDHVSTALFCPTETAVHNLLQEGITDGVHQVGDVMGDSLEYFLPFARERAEILKKINVQPKGYALATVHRASNTDDPGNLSQLAAAFRSLDIPVVFPVHPRTRKMLEVFSISLPKNVLAIDPIGYLEMLVLEENANCILTDSGGIQKEAYWLGVRCITLRNETEWVETVERGWNVLVGVDGEKIRAAFLDWRPAGERVPIYGDGHAAERIGAILMAE
jgi:UDP-N-acetylglucosamine 2-epimerase (non-hydrolysing)/UDP-GlcNAc3NAcA epimerase